MIFTNYAFLNDSLPAGPARDTMHIAVLRITAPARADGMERGSRPSVDRRNLDMLTGQS